MTCFLPGICSTKQREKGKPFSVCFVLFLVAPSGPTLNDKPEAKAANVPKVSGLERSRELSTDVPFALPIPSPQPVAAVVTSTSSAPTSSARASPLLKKEPVISAPAPPRLTPQPQPRPQSQPQPRPQSQPQLIPDLRSQPPSHIPPPLNYQVHHQVAHNGLNNIRYGEGILMSSSGCRDIICRDKACFK